MKGPGAAQPCNNAPFHSLSDTHTRSSMSDPPQLPPDLIWSAAPLSPASAPTDVFIIALSICSGSCEERRMEGLATGGGAGGVMGDGEEEEGQGLPILSLVTSPACLLLPSLRPLPPRPPSPSLLQTIIKLINF